MVFDIVDAVLKSSNAQGSVGVQQAANERLAVGIEGGREVEVLLGVHYFLEGALLVGGLEGRVAAQQLVYQHAERPVVDGLVVALCQNQFTVDGRQNV